MILINGLKVYKMRDLCINYDIEELQKELSCFISKNGDYNSQPNKNKIILHYQWREFYKKELELWNENRFYHNLPLQSWIYLNRKKYINKDAINLTDLEILRAFKISGIYIGNSQFSPFWIKKFIEEYNIKSVYDPTGGWGHRILGSYNIDYIYNDINKNTYNNCIKMVNELDIPNTVLYNNDSSKFTPNEDYECVFTCPPYWNKEKYSDRGAENLNYNNFLIWWDQTIKCSLKNNVKYFAYVISNDLKEDMNKVCILNKLQFIEEKQLSNNYNHFQRNSINIKKGETIQIFKQNMKY